MNKLIPIFLVMAIILTGCTAPALPQSTKYIDTGVDPNSWVLVPAGDFYYGIHSKVVSLDEDYEIMVTHVTNAQYAEYLNQALESGDLKLQDGEILGYYPGEPFDGYKHEELIGAGDYLHYPIQDPGTRLVMKDGKVTPLPGYENHPVALVTWFGANAYCNAMGARLPTEMEWEKAGRLPAAWMSEPIRGVTPSNETGQIFMPAGMYLKALWARVVRPRRWGTMTAPSVTVIRPLIMPVLMGWWIWRVISGNGRVMIMRKLMIATCGVAARRITAITCASGRVTALPRRIPASMLVSAVCGLRHHREWA